MGIDKQKIIRTSRLSCTCILLFLITWYYQVPERAWCLITIWFVMYEYNTVGGVFTKSYLRFAGTSLSAIYGMVIVYFCANNPLIDLMALVPGLFIYAYFFMGGEKTYIGTIGAVTLTIVLLNYNDIDTAIVRVFNIIIGIVGSMVMIRFFYPQYARDKIIETLATLLEELVDMLQDYLDQGVPSPTLQTKYLAYENKTLDSFASLNRFMIEAKMETKKAPFFLPSATIATHQFRLLFRLISVFIYYISTDDIRADPWVCNHLGLLSAKLKAITCKLLGQKIPPLMTECTPIPIDAAENEENTAIDSQRLKNQQSTEAILTNMLEEATLLQKEINQMVLIYEVYPVNIEKISRPPPERPPSRKRFV